MSTISPLLRVFLDTQFFAHFLTKTNSYTYAQKKTDSLYFTILRLLQSVLWWNGTEGFVYGLQEEGISLRDVTFKTCNCVNSLLTDPNTICFRSKPTGSVKTLSGIFNYRG